MNTQDIQSIINQLMGAKHSKTTDGRLALYEKLAKWRNSPENKTQFSNTGQKQSKLTPEQIQDVRDLFYHPDSISIMTEMAKQYGCSLPTIKKILTNSRYQIPNWNYPDFEQQKQIIDDNIEKIKLFDYKNLSPESFKEKYTRTIFYNTGKKYRDSQPLWRIDIIEGMSLHDWTNKWNSNPRTFRKLKSLYQPVV